MTTPPAAPHRHPLARAALIALGLVCVGLGFAGFVVPGLPGMPFLLVATWAFSKSNARLYHWMMTNRYFGRMLADYRAGLGMPRRIKVVAIAMVVVVVTWSAGFALTGPLRFIIAGLGMYGVWFIYTRPTRELVAA
jgi:uncharacterized membrane protein YbaN (DUF454 family)